MHILEDLMKTSQTRTLETPHVNDETGWRKTDTVWMLGLYGTAIGAGVLFLPINAGMGGLLPLIVMAGAGVSLDLLCPSGLNAFCPLWQQSGRGYHRRG